jgi:hypothetical protein
VQLRLADVQESLGDKGGALAILKAFVTNGKAVASPAEEGTPSSSAEDQNELMRLRCAVQRAQRQRCEPAYCSATFFSYTQQRSSSACSKAERQQ